MFDKATDQPRPNSIQNDQINNINLFKMKGKIEQVEATRASKWKITIELDPKLFSQYDYVGVELEMWST